MPNDYLSKISLGTVQFGMNYGINNKLGQVSEKEVFEILDYSHNKGIISLDTSYLYGSSESVIGKFFKDRSINFEIVSKLPSINNINVIDIFKKSLFRLNKNSIYGYLIHHFDFFKNNISIWNELVNLKKEGLINKIGFSIYYPDDLEFLYSRNIYPDIIQCPFNIFDQRFEKYFIDDRFKNIDFYVRSIFLQGLFFIDLKDLPTNISLLKGKLEMLNKISEEESISIYNLALSFVLNTKGIHKLIIGIDSLNHVKELVIELEKTYNNQNIHKKLLELKEFNEDLILPLNWNK